MVANGTGEDAGVTGCFEQVRRTSAWRRVVLVAVFGYIAWRLMSLLPSESTTIGSAGNSQLAIDPDAPVKANREFYAGMTMGCSVTITIDTHDPVKSKLAAREALLTLEALDEMLSDWKPASELSQWNESGALSAVVSEPFSTALARALEVTRASDGRFDPTVMPCVALWRASRESKSLPNAADLAAARAHCGADALRVDGTTLLRTRSDVRIDFGGIGKGFAAIRALETLRANGFPRAVVAIAGDIAIGDAPRGEAGWKIDVATPNAPTPIIVAQCALSTSGDSEQWIDIDGTRYAHIIDPRTGLGATKLCQVSIIGPLNAAVDALATACTLCDNDADIEKILANFANYGALVVRNGQITTLAAWNTLASTK